MKKRQRIKKICMVSVILIVIIWFMIYLTRFEVKNNNLQAEAGTSIEYILNENNLHDYISVSSLLQNRLTIDATGVNTNRAGEYTIKIVNNTTGETLKLPLVIIDTQDPVVEWYDYVPEVPVGVSFSADIFVKEAKDTAGIGKIYFYTEEDGRETSFTPEVPGEYTVSVVVQDINNRKVTKDVSFIAVQ